MNKLTSHVALIVLLAVSLICVTQARAADDKTVKVFILAGQSNMEGKANNSLLEHQATDAKTKEQFAQLRKGDEWIVRDDVFIKYLKRKGGLTIGYGSPGRTGVDQIDRLAGQHLSRWVARSA